MLRLASHQLRSMTFYHDTEQFRRIWMPYCVYKINDDIGGWIPLNRHYKLIGASGNIWLEYKDVPKFPYRNKKSFFMALQMMLHGCQTAKFGYIATVACQLPQLLIGICTKKNCNYLQSSTALALTNEPPPVPARSCRQFKSCF